MYPGPLTIHVAHAEPAMSIGLEAIFSERQDWTVACGALAPPVKVLPQLFVADYATGLTLARHHGARVPVLVVTSRDREWDVRSAIEAGVAGYVLQSCSPEELVRAAVRLVRGHTYLCRTVAPLVAAGMERRELTEREVEVLQLLAAGHCNKMIARHLGIAVETVKSHLKRLMSKLGASARTHAVVIAVERGLVGGARPSNPLEQ